MPTSLLAVGECERVGSGIEPRGHQDCRTSLASPVTPRTNEPGLSSGLVGLQGYRTSPALAPMPA